MGGEEEVKLAHIPNKGGNNTPTDRDGFLGNSSSSSSSCCSQRQKTKLMLMLPLLLLLLLLLHVSGEKGESCPLRTDAIDHSRVPRSGLDQAEYNRRHVVAVKPDTSKSAEDVDRPRTNPSLSFEATDRSHRQFGFRLHRARDTSLCTKTRASSVYYKPSVHRQSNSIPQQHGHAQGLHFGRPIDQGGEVRLPSYLHVSY